MENIWEFEDQENVDNPYNLLQETVKQLEKDSKGEIIGTLVSSHWENKNLLEGNEETSITYAVYLMSPKLRHYSYRLFEFKFNTISNPFPAECKLYAQDQKNNQSFTCVDTADFKEKLFYHIKHPITKGILTSIKVFTDIAQDFED